MWGLLHRRRGRRACGSGASRQPWPGAEESSALTRTGHLSPGGGARADVGAAPGRPPPSAAQWHPCADTPGPAEGAEPVGLTFHHLGGSQGLRFLLVPRPACGFVLRPCPGPGAPPVVIHNPALGKPEVLENAREDAIFLANSSPGQNRLLPCFCLLVT